MQNSIYRLIEPHNIVRIENNIDDNEKSVIVRPTHLSICNADQRYYQGTRDAEVLARKLPMALIHEGVGVVVADPDGEFKAGETVVMIPNTPYEEDEYIAENYLRSSKFRASGFDGFMQDRVAMRRDRLVSLPENVNRDVAAFTEITSVSNHAIDRWDAVAHGRRDNIAIWGDGSLAFITSLILRYRFPEAHIMVMAKHHEKAEIFHHVDEIYDIRNIPEDITIDHAFECVGGLGSPKAINQIIDLIKPEGTIAIMGVSENEVPINTRMILEKGLRVIGTSRSGRQDFENTVKMYVEHPEFVKQLEAVVDHIIEVNDIEDIHLAFEKDIAKNGGKTVMHWNI